MTHDPKSTYRMEPLQNVIRWYKGKTKKLKKGVNKQSVAVPLTCHLQIYGKEI